MKFYKYKQLARINCIGFDDELTNNQSSYYNTPFKFVPAQTQINTKLMRFRFKGLNNIQIGKHAKIVLESIYVPIVLNNFNYEKNRGGFQIRLKNLSSENTFDSSLDNHGSIVLFSHSCEQQTQLFFQVDATTGHIEIQAPTDAAGAKIVHTDATTGAHSVHYQTDLGNYMTTKTGVSFFNNNPKVLYNFDIPNQNFLNQNMLEFELIYYLRQGEQFILADDGYQLENFQCSLVIYDIDEEELLLKDTDEVNFKLMRPQNPLFKI